eukprot:SAG11_NODE_4286_length_1968_cov_1.533440_3_plen_86_part_00
MRPTAAACAESDFGAQLRREKVWIDSDEEDFDEYFTAKRIDYLKRKRKVAADEESGGESSDDDQSETDATSSAGGSDDDDDDDEE